jgi:RNA polymerase sigma factor (sigma-70 family)
MEEISKGKYNLVDSAWKRFQEGEYAALGEVFRKLYGELYYYGVKLLPMEEVVRDTIQDIFVDLWSRKEKIACINNIKAYLFVAVRHQLLLQIKKLRVEKPTELTGVDLPVFSREDSIVQEENNTSNRRLLNQSLEKLTERQREVIILRFNHEMEFEDIAQIMRMNLQSVRNLLFRALQKVRSNMTTQRC